MSLSLISWSNNKQRQQEQASVSKTITLRAGSATTVHQYHINTEDNLKKAQKHYKKECALQTFVEAVKSSRFVIALQFQLP